MRAGPRSFPLTHGGARRVEWQATPGHSHKMQKRRLGRSDLYLTPLGLGTWAIGGPWAFGWGPQDAANLAFVEGLRRIAEGEGCSLAGLAIAWVLRHPETASAIVGARSRDPRARETAAVATHATDRA